MSTVAHTHRARPNGWWGMAIFVATEATLFGTIFGTYFYLRFKDAHWPPPGVHPPSATIPLVLTAVLVATTLPVLFAYRSARAGLVARARWLLVLAMVVQAGFFAMQIQLFSDDLGKFSPQGSSYGSIFFTMLGAHQAHVALGLLLEGFLVVRLFRGLTHYRLVAFQSIAFYWYFVNVLALAVVGAQLSAAV